MPDILATSSTNADARQLMALGYKPELQRWMGLSGNFGISFAIICIVAGGITAFPAAFSAGGGAAIGIMWPIGSLFVLFVAAAMAQLAAAFPSAGGPYHWAAILGGRGWGWACAWFNLLGLIFVTASINIGFYNMMRDLFFGIVLTADISSWVPTGEGSPGWWRQTVFILCVTLIQALINHHYPRQTFKLIAIGAAIIIATALGLTVALLAYAGPLDFSRLFEFRNFTGATGGNVWPDPFSLSPVYIMALGMLHVAYTNTGFDASAHVAEETRQAIKTAPRGILLSVLYSAIFGYLMVCAFVLAIPESVVPAGQTKTVDGVAYAASQGWGLFNWLIGQSSMPHAIKALLIAGILAANFIAGLAVLASSSRMLFAFARDGGVPNSDRLNDVDPERGVPSVATWVCAVLAIIATLYGKVFLVLSTGSAVLLFLAYLIPVAFAMLAEITGRRKPTKDFSMGNASVLVSMLALFGGLALIFVGVQPPQQAVLYLLVVMSLTLMARWQLMHEERSLSVIFAVLAFLSVGYFMTGGFAMRLDGPSIVIMLVCLAGIAMIAAVPSGDVYRGPAMLEDLRAASQPPEPTEANPNNRAKRPRRQRAET
jgi:amino acid transporter